MKNKYMGCNELTAYIVAGGKGTRSANPKLAKILIEIEPGLTIFDLHLQNIANAGIPKIVFLLGEYADQIIPRIEAAKRNYPNIDFSWMLDTEDSGTLGALLNAVQIHRYEEILVILGDIVIAANYKLLYKNWIKSEQDCAVIVHPNLHPYDSDIAIYDLNSKMVGFLSKREINKEFTIPPRAFSGCFFFRNSAFREVSIKSGDISGDLIPLLIERNSVHSLNSSFFFQDAGTEKRLQNIKSFHHQNGILNRGKSDRAAIFLDRDGTIFDDIGTSRKYVLEHEISSNTFKAIKKANVAGIPIFIVTNQPGIAKGQIETHDVLHIQTRIELLASNYGAIIDDFKFCPHHPEKGFAGEVVELKIDCKCRKPGIEMFAELSIQHGINLQNSFLIGDSDVDRQAAIRANMNYVEVVNSEILGSAIVKVLEALI